MNPEAKQQLENILKKATVDQSDLSILKARRDYLTDEQIARYFPEVKEAVIVKTIKKSKKK